LRLYQQTPEDFDFATAVGSYGFFALAPNRWDPGMGALTTALQADGLALEVRIRTARRSGRDAVCIEAPGHKSLTGKQRRGLLSVVRRMLRLDEDLTDFHGVCACEAELRPAAEMRFGRLLRSPTLFEDVVKTMCTCNITWRQTLSVVRRLVERYGDPAVNNVSICAFPRPERIAATSEKELRESCGVGYRADWIITFTRQVVEGEFDVVKCEDAGLPTDELYRYLRTIRGVGDYAASGLCILLGRYDRLAFDTVLMNHYRQRFPRRKATPTNIKKHYARYHPYEYLVYWWELWNRHLDETGQPTSWTAA
jgi:3-methyladenine DNA glycosylase/8-oxoguanine DNA glycosylase